MQGLAVRVVLDLGDRAVVGDVSCTLYSMITGTWYKTVPGARYYLIMRVL